MKSNLLLAAIAMSFLFSVNAQAPTPPRKEKKMLYHVVALKFKTRRHADQIKTGHHGL